MKYSEVIRVALYCYNLSLIRACLSMSIDDGDNFPLKDSECECDQMAFIRQVVRKNPRYFRHRKVEAFKPQLSGVREACECRGCCFIEPQPT